MRSAAQFDLIERGVCNYLVSIGRQQADSGEVMLNLRGPLLDTTNVIHNLIVLVTGTTYSPKVCDVVACEFADTASVAAQPIPPMTLVKIASRQSMVASKFSAIASETSD